MQPRPDGLHDSGVFEAADRLGDAALAVRAIDEARGWLARWRAMQGAAARGMSVAPYWRRPLVELVEAEADRRREVGDPAATVWAAWARAVVLRVDSAGVGQR